MKKCNLNSILHLALVCGLVLAIAPATWAQGDNPFELSADVDNDGVVGPTDIQHVINDALGLNERGADAIDRPLRQYIVASPRASLSLLPGSATEDPEACTTVGAATNFPRRNGRLLVREGKGIAFRYDRNIEGVWHKDACGLLRSELIVEIQALPAPEPGDEGDANAALTRPELDEEAWRPVGRDGAAGIACGPRIGTAIIGVRHLFDTPGDFIVRSTIRTFAIPEREIVAEGEVAEFCGAARAVNRVLTHVRVLPRRAVDADLDWETDENPGAVGADFGTRLTNEPESNVALP